MLGTGLMLCAIVASGRLTYSVLIAYAVIVGSCAAFAMPIRDAALNGIVEREAERGKFTPIATAAAVTTAVQIGAQIAGILIAQFAGKTPAPYLAVQALALALGAGVALLGMRAPKPSGHERTLQGALRDLREGLVYSFRDPVMSPMLTRSIPSPRHRTKFAEVMSCGLASIVHSPSPRIGNQVRIPPRSRSIAPWPSIDGVPPPKKRVSTGCRACNQDNSVRIASTNRS